MTPKRRKYFIKCSDKEVAIRRLMRVEKSELKKWKKLLTSGECDNEENKEGETNAGD